MCGIIGYIGDRATMPVLLKGLKRLEYRGYDSAGVALLTQTSTTQIEITKTEGKISRLDALVPESSRTKTGVGIGHTRWATHGKTTTQNAHPHRTGDVVLVHNGIIENYLEIKERLKGKGIEPVSETDSELFGYLVLDRMDQGDSLSEAVRKSFEEIEGASSVVVISEREPDTIVGIRNGSPLVAATDPQGGAILASDAQPILEYTQEVVFLDNGEMVVATRKGLQYKKVKTGKSVDKKPTRLDWSADKLDKQGYAHYMLKEIFEQPSTIVDTLNGVLDRAHTDPFPLAPQPGVKTLEKASQIRLIAAGTSWHAAFLGKYWLEDWAGIPASVELASEFRYRNPVLGKGDVILGISQSGETADTLAVINDMNARTIPTLAVTNVRGSTISREAGDTFFTSAGPEIGVAATKTFTAQILMMLLMSGYLGLKSKKAPPEKITNLFQNLIRIPNVLETALQSESEFHIRIRNIAKKVSDAKGFFFIGRGYSYPLALEGALKLKEIAYIHAEGYAGGELKHGPIAMIDKDMVLVVICPKDSVRDKTVSNLQEVKARGARILGIGSPSDRTLESQCDEWIPLPMSTHFEKEMDESLYPFLIAPALQLLSYEIALLKGTDVDQPRNLAKSVTVE